MAVLDPEELFDQAELLIVPRQPGPPRLVDVRRAISAAHYGVFHHVCTQAADLFVGKTLRREPRYSRVYRSLDHGSRETACKTLQGARLDPAYVSLLPQSSVSSSSKQFAADVIDWKARRHRADYDPHGLLRTIDVRIAGSPGRRPISSCQRSPIEAQTAFLTPLMFKGR